MARHPSDADRFRVREAFGVADEQIDRDHLISHLLAGLSASRVRDRITFIGGTALSRSFLPDVRLSEDIDLIVDHRTRDVVGEIQRTLERAVSRSHGRLRWNPSLTELMAGVTPAVATTATASSVRIQLLAATGYPAWPRRNSILISATRTPRRHDYAYSPRMRSSLRRPHLAGPECSARLVRPLGDGASGHDQRRRRKVVPLDRPDWLDASSIRVSIDSG